MFENLLKEVERELEQASSRSNTNRRSVDDIAVGTVATPAPEQPVVDTTSDNIDNANE